MATIRTAFRVRAVGGECEPVAGLEIGARFHYTDAPSTWSTARTDGEGYAHFDDEHLAPPTEACLFVCGDHCLTLAPLEAGGCYILEL